MHEANAAAATGDNGTTQHHLRFHFAHRHAASVFGDDWFGRKAEGFARYFGTPHFLVGQTLIVALWIIANTAGFTRFDAYPFILLNLAFSLQAAYAAPLILLAQTRQADRDRAMADADARHREALACAAESRQRQISEQGVELIELIGQNTHLTELTNELSRRIEGLTAAIHGRIVHDDDRPA